MKPARYLAAGLVAVAIGVGAFLAFGGSAGGTAPNVSYTLLDGSKGSLDQMRGKVVLVNFWATSCDTCIHEMPQMVATHEKYRSKGFETLAVAMSYDPPAYVINYAETRKLPFGVVIDNTGSFAKSFGKVQLTPTSVLIDKRGRIVKTYVGEPDFVALHQLVEKLLAQA
ncbi:MAG: TlpA family protein disulfide reductase [Proteobacteria bacterium]|nr:TlpA family protein disulfide reductase [Pseudomonadota bacterium]